MSSLPDIDYTAVSHDIWTIKLSFLAANKSESDYEDIVLLSDGPTEAWYEYGNIHSFLFAEKSGDAGKIKRHRYILWNLSVGFLRKISRSVDELFDVPDPLIESLGGVSLLPYITVPLYDYRSRDYYSGGEEYNGEYIGEELVYKDENGDTFFM